MQVIVIKRKSNDDVVAVVETGPMSDGAVALAWAKSSGYETFPKDLKFETGIKVTSLGSVLHGITPCSTLDELKQQGAEL